MKTGKFVNLFILVLVLFALSVVPASAQSNHSLQLQIFDDLNGNGIFNDVNENYPTGLNVTADLSDNCTGTYTNIGLKSTVNGYVTLATVPSTHSICLRNVKLILPNQCWSTLNSGIPYHKTEYFSVGASPITWTFVRAYFP